jgi:5-methyltetrahydrofolate--homocysteine methyltransferase
MLVPHPARRHRRPARRLLRRRRRRGRDRTFGAFATARRVRHRRPAHEINVLAAARIAREVADGFAADGRPRFVAGSIGPGHQVAERSATSASPSCATPTRCRPRAARGRRRPVLIETCIRPARCQGRDDRRRRAMAAEGPGGPLQVQVTMETTGRMLPGTEIGAALTALDAMRPTSSASTAPPARPR